MTCKFWVSISEWSELSLAAIGISCHPLSPLILLDTKTARAFESSLSAGDRQEIAALLFLLTSEPPISSPRLASRDKKKSPRQCVSMANESISLLECFSRNSMPLSKVIVASRKQTAEDKKASLIANILPSLHSWHRGAARCRRSFEYRVSLLAVPEYKKH